MSDLETLDKELSIATYQLTFYQASAELRERRADAVAGVKAEDIPPNTSLSQMKSYLEESGVPNIVPSEEEKTKPSESTDKNKTSTETTSEQESE